MIKRKLKLLEEEKNAVQRDNPNLFSEEFQAETRNPKHRSTH